MPTSSAIPCAAAGFIRGVESKGVGVPCGELYLTDFKITVKGRYLSSLMCACNRINGKHCSGSKFLLTYILRKEWDLTVWWSPSKGDMSDRLKAFRAGCSLKRSGSSRINPWMYGSEANPESQKITPCQVNEKVKLGLVQEEGSWYHVTNMYDYLMWGGCDDMDTEKPGTAFDRRRGLISRLNVC